MVTVIFVGAVFQVEPLYNFNSQLSSDLGKHVATEERLRSFVSVAG
jgi:hypothetical protein